MTSGVFESPNELEARVRASPAGKGVVGRTEVARLAAHDSMHALSVARKIEHPWYRCQALASIVEHNLSMSNAQGILEEALAAACSQAEPNRIASVAFWPLQLLLKVNGDAATEHVLKLIGVIAQETHGLRRLDGLHGILSAVVSEAALRNLVLPRFVETASVCSGWRTERIINSAVLSLAPYDFASAKELLATRPSTRFTKAARIALSQVPNADT